MVWKPRSTNQLIVHHNRPKRLMERIENHSTSSDWVFICFDDTTNKPLFKLQVPRRLSGERVLALLLQKIEDHAQQCPRCESWVNKHYQWSPLRNVCLTCAEHMKQGEPLLSRSTSDQPRQSAKQLYQWLDL